jgi:hypothetical protein
VTGGRLVRVMVRVAMMDLLLHPDSADACRSAVMASFWLLEARARAPIRSGRAGLGSKLTQGLGLVLGEAGQPLDLLLDGRSR